MKYDTRKKVKPTYFSNSVGAFWLFTLKLNKGRKGRPFNPGMGSPAAPAPPLLLNSEKSFFESLPCDEPPF